YFIANFYSSHCCLADFRPTKKYSPTKTKRIYLYFTSYLYRCRWSSLFFISRINRDHRVKLWTYLGNRSPDNIHSGGNYVERKTVCPSYHRTVYWINRSFRNCSPWSWRSSCYQWWRCLYRLCSNNPSIKFYFYKANFRDNESKPDYRLHVIDRIVFLISYQSSYGTRPAPPFKRRDSDCMGRIFDFWHSSNRNRTLPL